MYIALYYMVRFDLPNANIERYRLFSFSGCDEVHSRCFKTMDEVRSEIIRIEREVERTPNKLVELRNSP